MKKVDSFMDYAPPSRLRHYAGELAESYLSRNNWFTTTIKVITYIGTIGLLPLIAYGVRRSYRIKQEKNYEGVLGIVKNSLQDAIKVADLIGQYRFKHEAQRVKVADTIAVTIGTNYNEYVTLLQNNNPKAPHVNPQWSLNFGLTVRDRMGLANLIVVTAKDSRQSLSVLPKSEHFKLDPYHSDQYHRDLKTRGIIPNIDTLSNDKDKLTEAIRIETTFIPTPCKKKAISDLKLGQAALKEFEQEKQKQFNKWEGEIDKFILERQKIKRGQPKQNFEKEFSTWIHGFLEGMFIDTANMDKAEQLKLIKKLEEIPDLYLDETRWIDLFKKEIENPSNEEVSNIEENQ